MKANNLLVLRNVKITTSVPQPITESSDSVNTKPAFVSVKEIAYTYGISKSLIYELIKKDKDFPGKNVGIKKKYIIHLQGFTDWLNNRQREVDAHVPTGLELIRRHRK
ncbi:MAG TPA: hypothetical protein VNJ08_10475 [Bacteriovoracaceae bacterium]|nr:hypothetical protein [Bacteriovoracaceae bacterium]